MVLGDVMGELVGRRAERDDDRQVVEQLQRRGGPMTLVGVAAAEPASMVGAIGERRRHRGRF
jgi:hypothetical protein